MDSILTELIATATVAIALFGVAFCLMQARFRQVYLSFALFLLAVGVNNLPTAFGRVREAWSISELHPSLMALEVSSGLCLAPLFWVYVHRLTSADQRLPRRLWVHLLIPGLALVTALMILAVPVDLMEAMADDQPVEPELWALVPLLLLIALALLVYPQMGVYLWLIVRRLIRYRTRLRDVYASTERHEMSWIIVIGLLMSLFWGGAGIGIVATLLGGDYAVPESPFAALGLALFAAAALWGVRQRPGLMPGRPGDGPERGGDDSPKYEKSALTPAAATRIERKLRAAMVDDHLHRDANLSLWDLAQHVGASPNYISQTLNEAIGMSFFDFVNGHRIAEAQSLLRTTNDTVLAICYAVGFNSRSSFYTAFRKVTGQTPAAYRKTLPCPNGPDQSFALSGRSGPGATEPRPG